MYKIDSQILVRDVYEKTAKGAINMSPIILKRNFSTSITYFATAKYFIDVEKVHDSSTIISTQNSVAVNESG